MLYAIIKTYVRVYVYIMLHVASIVSCNRVNVYNEVYCTQENLNVIMCIVHYRA